MPYNFNELKIVSQSYYNSEIMETHLNFLFSIPVLTTNGFSKANQIWQVDLWF